MNRETRHRREIVCAGKLLHQQGYVAATGGNLSVRLGPDSILITPANVSKGMMQPHDLAVVDMEGHTVAGSRNPSSEVGMHLLIYWMRKDVNAIVHAHPPTATGCAAAGMPLDPALLCEAILEFGEVPVADDETPGAPEVANSLASFVAQHDAVLMASHGVVTYGDDIWGAFMKMERIEHFARIALVTRLLGQQHPLTREQIDMLAGLRRNRRPGRTDASELVLAPGEGFPRESAGEVQMALGSK